MRRRVAQQKIYAPLSGRVSRIGKTIGPGQTVKKDDELLEIVPIGGESAVELTLNEADASLVRVGRKVRLHPSSCKADLGFPLCMPLNSYLVVASE